MAAISFCAQAQLAQKEFAPKVNRQGKDVIWVPTPQALVDKILDMAEVSAGDYVIDLGSGDGRTVIAAARRGARALGIEYDAELVELSRRNAEKEGVAGRAAFVKADLFESDFSRATVITMYLLPQLNYQLRPKILALKPGTRIVSNSFNMAEWIADDTGNVISIRSFFAPALRRIGGLVPDPVLDYFADYCTFFCTAYLWIVPARVAGVWRLPQGELRLEQSFQMLSGTLKSGARIEPLANGRLRGDRIRFSAGGAEYHGRVDAGRIEGSVKSGGNTTAWSATLHASYPLSMRTGKGNASSQ